MPLRDRIDPETTRVVEQRLQWLLHEHSPGVVTDQEIASTPEPPVPSLGPRPTRGTEPPPVTSSSRPSPPHAHRLDADLDEPEASPERVPRASAGGGLPTTLAAFRRPHLIIVAVIIALGLVVAGWAVLRARPVAVAVTPPVASSAPTKVPPGPPSAAGASSAASSSAPATGVVVHVLGAVRKPGLVTLTAGDRVQDALDAAGGLTGKADAGELNLAQAVTDGQQIVVGTKTKPAGEVRNGSTGGGSGPVGAGGSAPGSGQPVNLNTASQAELEALPGVGPVMAGKILGWRTENGRFSRVEELQEIDGVGPKTYAKLAPLCRV